MNRFLYRIIFNAARGLFMAVEETAIGGGRGSSPGTRSVSPQATDGRVSQSIDLLEMRRVAFAALCLLGMQPVLVEAQVVAAPSAPAANKPAVGVTANGVPLVQITTPNAAGVSNNSYSQYNVGTQGLILNNSPGNVQTQQGGYVGGNPYLSNGSARIIVNQVVGGSPSQLLGYTEVAGAQAQVVIANPAGIYCNGCGFINTSRGVLTTGTPVFGGSGSLDAFRVTGGQIQIGSAGLNGSNVDQVDLIARSVQVNGKLWAGRELNVVAGANDVRYDGLAAQALAPDANQPDVAIDVAQLGGMYAGKITLVGTEKGVGVNSAGTIEAQAGNVSLSSQGKVTLSGSTSASGNVDIHAAADVSNAGSVYAGQSATVAADGHVSNTGTTAAAGNTTVTGASIDSSGALGAGIDASGRVTGSGSLALTGAGTVAATGTNLAGGNASVSGGSIEMAGARTRAGGNVSLNASGTNGSVGNIDQNNALLSAGGNVALTATGQVTNDGGQLSGAQLDVTASALSNRAGKLTQTGTGTGTTSVAVTGALDNTGGTLATNAQNTRIRSGSLTNDGGEITAAGTGALSIDTGVLANRGGTIGANGTATVNATSVDNTAGSLSSMQKMKLAASGDVENARGTLVSGGGLDAAAANVRNSGGRIVSLNGDGLSVTATGQITNAAGTTAQGEQGGVIGGNGGVDLRAASLTNSGTLTAAQQLGATVGGTLDNSNGAISAGTLNASANAFKNAAGTVSAGMASMNIAQLDNSHGKIRADQLALNATNLTNEGGSLTQLGAGPMAVNVSNAIDNANGGVIQTNSTDLTLAPATLDNDGGTVTHTGTGALTIDAGNGAGLVSNAGGKIVSNGATTVESGTLDNVGGTIGGRGGLTANAAQSLDNSNGSLISNADLGVTTGGAFVNAAGTVSSGNDTSITAGTITNSGNILAARTLSVTTNGALDNSGGTLNAAALAAQAASLRNSGGTISADTVGLTISQLDNSSGHITANALTLTANTLTNQHGVVTQLGTGAMTLGVSGTVDNSNGGVIQTNSADLSITPAAFDNNGGTITHAGTGTLTIAPGGGGSAVTNVGGRIVSNGEVALTTSSLDDTGGTISAQGALSVSATNALNNTSGTLRSGGALSATTNGTLTNAGGKINAGAAGNGNASTLNVTAAAIDNASGLISNAGTGATAVHGTSSISNSNALGVTGMGAITGNGNVTLTTVALSNTQGGQLSGANLQLNASSLNNNGGLIGNAANAAGDVGISTTGAVYNAGGQINAARNLAVTATTLAGGGAYSAVGDLALNLQGDFANSPGYSFSAGHNLSFTLPGTFTNGGTLLGINDLTINAGSIGNSGTMMAGGLLSTRSNTLVNTGTIVGGSVSLAASQSLSNLGTSALIGATDSTGKLELLSADIENRDDNTATDAPAMTAIYGLGRVVLAGGKDASGNYTKAGLVHNQSGLIQSGGDMTIAANQVTNTRRVVSTSGFTSAVDPSLLASLGISLSGCTAIHMEACSGQVVGWVSVANADPSLIGGVFIDPPHGGQWNSGYQRTTYTGVAMANTVTTISPQAQIVAGGNLDASSVDTFQNYWSRVAAVGNIGLPALLDQNSWRGQSAPQVQVTYSGQYHYRNYDGSIADWTYSFCASGCNAPADIRTYALPAYESSFAGGGTLSGTGVTINNTAGNASVTPLGLLPGQSVGGASAGSVSGSVAGGPRRSIGAQSVNGGTALSTGVAGANDPIIAGATAVTVLSNITVPQGGLFKQDTAPGATYLIETNPAFTNLHQWMSSDYYFEQLGMDPGKIQKRLGDGFYEQQLVQSQIMALTGKAVLTNYASTQTEFQALMASGAQLSKSLGLAPGMGLSAEQVSQLTSNVVIMQTQVVDGQSVLVPVVYLAKASQQNMSGGPVIAATDIDLKDTRSFTNSGTVVASNSLTLTGQSIDNQNGTLQSGGLMTLATVGNVDLTSATVKAGSLALQAGGDLILDTAVKTTNQVNDNGATRINSTLGPLASISVEGDAAIITGGDFQQNAGSLTVGGNLGMNIGGDWTLGAVQTGEKKVVERANGVSNTDINQATGSSVKIGGISQIGVGGDLTAKGAQIELSGGGAIAANGNVTLGTASATSTVNSNSSGSDHHGSYTETLHTSDQALTGTMLKGGDTITIAAGRDLTISGSAVNLDKGNANLLAAGDVNIGAATETHELNSHETHSHSNVVSGAAIASGIDQATTYSQSSTVSADGVNVVSNHDINVTGSNIVGTNDVALRATRDVNITTSQDTTQSSSYYEKKETGLLTNGGLSVTVGSRSMAQQDENSSVTNHGSVIGSSQGSLTIQAGKDATITGSTVVAGENVGIAAQNVTVNAAYDTYKDAQSQQFSQSGLSVGLGGGLVGLGQSMASAINQGQHSGDSRLAAVQAVAAAEQAYKNRGGIKDAANALSNGNVSEAAKGVQVQISIGSSHSSSNATTSITNAKGSSIIGNGNVSITATGTSDATGNVVAGTGNIAMTGASVLGKNVTLDAHNAITLQSAESTEQNSSSNSSSGWSAGVAIGVGKNTGISVFANASNAHGQGNGDGITQTNTTLAAGNTLTMTSGGDTMLSGARVSGDKVKVDVGGALTMTSRQDTSNYSSNQHNTGVSGSFTFGYGGGAEASIGHTSVDADYASVNQQTGIVAGKEGFDVNVAGHTQLNGAEIASAAPADSNTLTTGSLGFTDIQNKMSYSGKTEGFSTSGGPSFAQTSDSASGVTRAAVSPATIVVKADEKNGTDSTAGLSRDTANANQTVQNTFNLQKVQNDMAFAQAFGKVATFAVAEAATQLANSSPEMKALFGEGGAGRDVLHAAVAAIGAALSGGNIGGAIAGSLAGDMLQSLAQPIIDQTVSQLPLSAQSAARNALNEIVATAGGAAAGALVGGGSSGALAGAGAAIDNELYNRQLHQSESDKLKKLQDGKSAEEQHKLAAAECALVHCGDGVPDNDPNKAALTRLQNEGQSYTYEQGLLRNAGAFDGYGKADRINDWYDRNQILYRTVGAVQGVTGVASAVAALGAGCSTIIACGLATTAATGALDYSKAGFTQMVSGSPTSTYGEQVLQGLGMSPYAASLTYAGLNLGAAAGTVAANNAAAQAAARGVPQSAEAMQAEIQSGLTQQVADLRATLTGSAKTSGNVGVAQINIPGVQPTMAASSQIANPTDAQKALGFVGQVPEIFRSSSVWTGGNDPVLLNRSVDSEAKILNNVAAQLGDNTSVSGTINLLTERAPCASCSNVIQQFQSKYPNITINVMDNGGVIKPTKW
ncbi:hemagglutinin repeat-containing protein [Trinickia caryophylli]|uniref:Filamentous hemagglutinin n=1 Tax=Trinickia caryophylli TaxID=28094 RepID=A0A1X7GBR6_TRICW|nr:hemagglutinin repeat-containing protein [Trinickia caryophylli]PMS10842.1 filamentous hemagglutinin N-terminal domain-containing protein [Trinickia caryophylli]TRX13779.1 filamentous hemagglutinin N-terminal domain-containing protein [Trinickia caryophylli]WQE15370.1 hemagglutinin repeat-containing protein [Trinickia caryophylli]SMF67371.1 filamentous hemagglutinin [Trinickia caryophylli]GLU33895.1 cell surface protein [Trinickia caryophylli]